jgi:putative two-component system response regulator
MTVVVAGNCGIAAMTAVAEPATILVVDDTPDNIELLSRILRPTYKVKAALNGFRALTIATTPPIPDMILLDVMMPGMDGYEVCRQLKAHPTSANIPVIFVTAMSDEQDEEHGLSLGAVDYVTKPISPAIVRARLRTHLALYRQNLELERKVRERTEELLETRLEIIRRLGRASEFRDNETGLHIIRMSHYSYLMAQGLGVSQAWADLLLNAAPMHDVGKIGVPDEILLKPTRLDPAEWELMSRHPEIGAEIIGDHGSEILRMSREIALCHHEKWEGSGYPKRLKGTDIPLSARIVAIADVFDALTSERPYKHAWPVEEALAYMFEQAGKHFEPSLIEIFRQVLPKILEIKDLYAERNGAFQSPYRD